MELEEEYAVGAADIRAAVRYAASWFQDEEVRDMAYA